MLKNNIIRVFLFAAVCLLSSCFQIIEEINMKKNGSGDVTLIVNLSKSKTKVASIMLLDSINGHKVPSEQDIQKQLNEISNYLKQSTGISNVKKSLDLNNYIATVTFSFKDVSNINNLTKSILEKQKIKAVNLSSYTYNKQANTFARNYQYISEAKKQYSKLKERDQVIFKSATYTSIYRFEDEVQRISNPLAKISKSKKAIMLQCPVLDLIDGRTNLTNTIQLSK